MAIPLLAATLKAQDIYVGSGLDTIGEYSLSGTTVNAPLISGLRFPSAIAISGNNLFIVNRLSNTIGEYTTSGATVSASLVSGLSYPWEMAISGDDLFVGE